MPVTAEPPAMDFSTETPAADRIIVRNIHAPFAARRFVCSQLLTWELPGLLDAAELVASELATNAVEHGGGPFIRVRLVYRVGAVTLAIWDANGRDLPKFGGGDLDAEGGRGLLITAELSDRWGCYRVRSAGKVVWALLAI